MSNTDKCVLVSLIFTMVSVATIVLWTDISMSNLEEQIAVLYARQGEDSARVSELEQLPDKITRLETMSQYHQERLDYLSDTIALHKSESTTMYDDLLHEVNSFEEAVDGLTTSQIKLPTTWKGAKLSKSNGTIQGPSGRETYYNMDMSYCISRMRAKGYSEKEYPYWVRDDGCKMLGQFVMVAANFRIRPLGTILETSRGWGIVVDTGGFVSNYPKGIDIATTW